MKKIILTLPAFNEREGIGPLLREADAVFSSLDLAAEIVLVDDGSTDGTAEAARSLSLRTPFSVVSHERNKGLGEAIMTCLREGLLRAESEEDLIVCMDADYTHPPDTIPRMIEQAEAGSDLVIASRYRPGSTQRGVPPHRRLMSFAARWLFTWKLGLEGVRDYTCGFRAYKVWLVRKGLDHYGNRLITREGFACTDELLVRLSHFNPRIREVPFALRYDRKHGRSKIDLMTTIIETLKMLFGGGDGAK